MIYKNGLSQIFWEHPPNTKEPLLMKQDVLHLIGNAHLDPIWLWKRSEGYAEIKATFQSALDRMEEFGSYIFTCACASYYQWIEENEPELFEKIRVRVQEGRWAIVGGMWVQPDCNVPSGESFARHLLYSQRYFEEKFGRAAVTGYNVDSFGHNGMLPQLLRKSGITSYVFQRPNDRENQNLPHLFLWESPDGSRVTAFKILFNYNDSWWGYEEDEETKDMSPYRAKAVVTKRLASEWGIPLMGFYGVGNHGGGPTKACLFELDALCRDNPDIQFSSPARYFAEIQETCPNLPVISGDLQHHAIGCYSAYSPIKQKNRMAENRLISAEKYDVLAAESTGSPSQRERIREGWKLLLFNQFHDILAGCCIKSALEEAGRYMDAAWCQGDQAASFAMQRIAWHINTSRGIATRPSGKEDWILWESEGEGAPVTVFNPHCFPARAQVVINHSGVGALEDDTGVSYPLQKIRGPQSLGSDFQNTLFLTELPPLGYRTFYLFRRERPAVPALFSTASEHSLENDCLRAEFDPVTGMPSRLTDKRNGRDVISAAGSALIIDDSSSDTWAHEKFYLKDVVGRFENARLEIIDRGPLVSTLRTTSRYGSSTLVQDFSLYADKAVLYVKCRIDYHEDHKIVKLSFPVNAACDKAVYEMPFGFLEKECGGMEEPGQRYASLGGTAPDGGESHLAIINDSKYSFSAQENELRMIAARSCGYADHLSDRAVPIELMEQGIQEFSYALLPHNGNLAEVTREAMLFNQPPELIMGTNHEGELPTTYRGIEIAPQSVICESIKYAEEGDGIILRLYETAGKSARAEIHLHIPHYEVNFSRTFSKNEIQTLWVLPDGTVKETDIVEHRMR